MKNNSPKWLSSTCDALRSMLEQNDFLKSTKTPDNIVVSLYPASYIHTGQYLTMIGIDIWSIMRTQAGWLQLSSSILFVHMLFLWRYVEVLRIFIIMSSVVCSQSGQFHWTPAFTTHIRARSTPISSTLLTWRRTANQSDAGSRKMVSYFVMGLLLLQISIYISLPMLLLFEVLDQDNWSYPL